MTSNNRNFKRVLAMLLLVTTVLTSLGSVGTLSALASVEFPYGEEEDSMVRTSLDEIQNVLTSTTYSEYLNTWKDSATLVTDESIQIDLVKDLDLQDSTATVNVVDSNTNLDLYKGLKNDSALEMPDGTEVILLCGDDGRVSFKINVKKKGFYNINIGYYTGNVAVYQNKRDDNDVIVAENGLPVVDFSAGDDNPAVGNYAAIERYVLIDGKVPYSEARSIELSRVWNDLYTFTNDKGETVQMYSDSKEFKDFVKKHYGDYENFRPFDQDGNGNELKPEKVLVNEWTNTYLYDSTGYDNSPLKFYLSEGEHIISFHAVRETVAISSITLDAADALPSYDEYYKKNGGDSAKYKGDKQIIVQAEYATTVSERTIYQLNNRSSVYSQPQDPALIRLNMIGGDKWEYVGQWIEWEVEVPEAGFYSIIPRSMQSYYSGVYVSRKLYINGSVPFQEAGLLRFDYSSEWVTDPLTNGKRDFLFYLEKGTNTIRLEVVLGEMADVLRDVNDSMQKINSYYRKILMITGAEPDEYRDYRFERLIPDVLKGLREQGKNLYAISDKLAKLMGGKGTHSATLDRVANICERMGQDAGTIAGSLDTLKSYSASLGTWLADTQNQPLAIDYLCIQAGDAEAPDAEAGFFENLWGGFLKFIMTFFSDYDSLGSAEDGKTVENAEKYAVEVWTVTSRDQAQIVRSLVDDSFNAKYGLPVVVKLVAGGTLLPATLAGTGPDVYMGAGQGDAINYAIRSAVLSLNNTTSDTSIGYNFDNLEESIWKDDPVYKPLIEKGLIADFGEVSTWFADSALTPLTLYGQTYGIPETMSFAMMFYRKDIFVELGIQVPNTWDEFYGLIYDLQKNKLDIGFPTGVAGSTFLMYQHGAEGETYYDQGNYDYYLNLFREYYNDVGYDKSKYSNVDEYLADIGYTYTDADGNIIPKTDGISINLDSDISLAKFNEVCELFTQYDFPVTYSFANRFRSGEMPLAIVEYNNYNSLIVFAPEINGLWEFTPLPGTPYKGENGEERINNSTVGAVSTMLMMRSVTKDNALAAWTFMQWWMSVDVQTSFGNEMVALLGPSAKQATANMKALEGMSWSKDESDNLFAQFNAVQCTPEYPGSYIVGRYTSFAFLNVYNNGESPIESMQSYIADINNELTRKRAEFDLPTTDTIKKMEEHLDKAGKLDAIKKED